MQDSTKHETSRPVTSSREAERPRTEDHGRGQQEQRGGNLDVTV